MRRSHGLIGGQPSRVVWSELAVIARSCVRLDWTRLSVPFQHCCHVVFLLQIKQLLDGSDNALNKGCFQWSLARGRAVVSVADVNACFPKHMAASLVDGPGQALLACIQTLLTHSRPGGCPEIDVELDVGCNGLHGSSLGVTPSTDSMKSASSRWVFG